MTNNFWIVSEEEKETISELNKKSISEEKKNSHFTIIDLEDYYKLFDKKEQTLIQKYLAINPKEIGYKLPFLGFSNQPKNLISVSNQVYVSGRRKHALSKQYLPGKVYTGFKKLVDEMEKDIKKRVLVEWGYRSPACQVHNFFKFFQFYKFNFLQTIKRVCFPDYSEHVCSQRQAIDFITEEGIDDDFDRTKEYKWLLVNTGKFGFYESYPKNNKLDMMYEPWHWHYES